MSEPRVVVIPIDNSENPDVERFRKMVEEFEYFATKSQDPFGPCGFLHHLLNKVLDRIYAATYVKIGKAQDPQPYICAATHIKRCKELSKEIAEQLSAAMGDIHRGGSEEPDMRQVVNKLMEMMQNIN